LKQELYEANERELIQQMLRLASRGVPRTIFSQDVVKLLIRYWRCDSVGLRIEAHNNCYCTYAVRQLSDIRPVRVHQQIKNVCEMTVSENKKKISLEELSILIMYRQCSAYSSCMTPHGSFWTNKILPYYTVYRENNNKIIKHLFYPSSKYLSVILVPFTIDDTDKGLLMLMGKRSDLYSSEEIEYFERFGEIIGLAESDRRAHIHLRERVKELSCLYGIAKLAAQPDSSLPGIMQGIADLLPAAWLYPDIAAARIELSGKEYTTANYCQGRQKLSADIVINGETNGSVEVAYLIKKLELDEGPFLEEERNLINEVARQIALIAEQKRGIDEQTRLRNQLHQARRLATVGQLAACAAHELNEPLATIIGFAQLIKDNPDMPPQITKDIEKIFSSSLYGREIVKKLLRFSQQLPPKKGLISFNTVINHGLEFVMPTCTSGGVTVIRSFDSSDPTILADETQIQQIIINIVVNALQAMLGGGTLTITTKALGDSVLLAVEDTGIGMNEDVLQHIFIPFFTTKADDSGTGLGLSIARDIVISHGGTITVTSTPGKGSRFEIRLPVSS